LVLEAIFIHNSDSDDVVLDPYKIKLSYPELHPGTPSSSSPAKILNQSCCVTDRDYLKLVSHENFLQLLPQQVTYQHWSSFGYQASEHRVSIYYI